MKTSNKLFGTNQNCRFCCKNNLFFFVFKKLIYNLNFAEDSKQEMPASEKYAMAVKLQKFFENKPKKPFIVKKPTQLFDSSDEKSTVDIRKEDLEDIKSSQWYVMSPCGDKVGPVSLSVLKNWSQTRVALESKIYNSSQTEDQAKPLTDVLHLAFDGK